MRYGVIVGRVLLSVVFILSGVGKIMSWQGTAGFMASHGLPAVGVLLPLTVLCEIGGGLLLLTGLAPQLGAIVLFLFLIPTTVTFHNFWAYTGQDRQMQQVNFLKNVAIMGGLLVAASGGGAPVSSEF